METSSHFNETIERYVEAINYCFRGFNCNRDIYENKNLTVMEMDAIYGPDRTAARALINSLSFLGVKAEPIIDEEARKFKGVRVEGKEYLV